MSLAPYTAMNMGPEQVTLKFRFQINGTDDPDFQCPAGAVADVVREDVGVFTVYLPDGFRPLTMLGGFAKVLPATPATDQQVTMDLADFDADAGTFVLNVLGALDTTVAAEEPVDNDWIYVEATFARREHTGTVGSL